MKIKKLCKSMVLGLVLGTVLFSSSSAFANTKDEVLLANPDRMWSGKLVLRYSESSPPPYKFYTNEKGYSGWVSYITLGVEAGTAEYAGWLYAGNTYPIPSKVKVFLSSLGKFGGNYEK